MGADTVCRAKSAGWAEDIPLWRFGNGKSSDHGSPVASTVNEPRPHQHSTGTVIVGHGRYWIVEHGRYRAASSWSQWKRRPAKARDECKMVRMTASYFDLARELSDAAQDFARTLRKENDWPSHPDVEQGAKHLDAIVGDLDSIDEDGTLEIPGTPGPLAESAAVAYQVVDVVVDLQGVEQGEAMTSLQGVINRVTNAGYVATAPSDLEWFGDDVPEDGSSW